jgi:hypothetical protein
MTEERRQPAIFEGVPSNGNGQSNTPNSTTPQQGNERTQ